MSKSYSWELSQLPHKGPGKTSQLSASDITTRSIAISVDDVKNEQCKWPPSNMWSVDSIYTFHCLRRTQEPCAWSSALSIVVSGAVLLVRFFFHHLSRSLVEVWGANIHSFLLFVDPIRHWGLAYSFLLFSMFSKSPEKIYHPNYTDLYGWVSPAASGS